MRRVLIVATTALLLSYGPGYAQMALPGAGLPGAGPGMGSTSPLGMGPDAPVGATGIPMGATELATPGISPGPVSGASTGSLGTTCSSMGMGSTMPAGTSTSTGLFSAGGVGTDATQLESSNLSSMSSGTCTQTPGTSTATPSTATAGSTLGIPTVPLGSTELGNAGLSPAPCPSMGSTSTATDGTLSGSC